jgi:5-(carboxyamino)imidazole ribonucleotide mutase
MRLWDAKFSRQRDIRYKIFAIANIETGMKQTPEVGVVMGSKSDWETMRATCEILEAIGVPHERRVVSAHRTPDLLVRYAKSAQKRGLRVIIAGAGGAAHLPGMLAAHTTVPVLGVPVESRVLRGVDSLLSIVQMPAGIPVATFAIGVAGAKNAALFAVAMIAQQNPSVAQALAAFRKKQTADALASTLD